MSRHACLLSIASILLVAAIMIAPVARAVDIDYSIEDYIPERLVDLSWRLTGDGSLYGADETREPLNDTATFSTDYPYDYSESGGTISLSSDATYTFTTVPVWYVLDLNLYGYLNSSSNESTEDRSALSPGTDLDTYEYSYKSNQASIEFQAEGGKYMSGDLFVGGRAEVYHRMNSSESESNTFDEARTPVNATQTDIETYVYDSKSPQTNHTTRLEVAALPGSGRVYDGRFASTALYMIEELEDEGLLARVPTKDEMLQLTEMIYQYRERHIIDNRIRRIEALTDIVGYLQSIGVVLPTGPVASLLLQDVWDFFPNSERKFGSRIRGGIGFDHYNYTSDYTNEYFQENLTVRVTDGSSTVDTNSFSQSFNHSNTHDKATESQSYLTGWYELFKPLNRQYQFDLSAQAWLYLSGKHKQDTYSIVYDQAGTETSRSTTDYEGEYSSYYRFRTSASLSYFLDARTSFSLSGVVDYVAYDISHNRIREISGGATDTTVNDFNGLSNLKLRLNGSTTYRISIPTSVSLSVTISSNDIYQYYNNVLPFANDDRSRTYYGLNFSVSHYLY